MSPRVNESGCAAFVGPAEAYHVGLNVELSMHSPGVLPPGTECQKTTHSWGKVTPKDLLEFSNDIN